MLQTIGKIDFRLSVYILLIEVFDRAFLIYFYLCLSNMLSVPLRHPG